MQRTSRRTVNQRIEYVRASAVALAMAWPATVLGQPQPVPSPLTFESALQLAGSRNLAVEADRRQRSIREAAIRTARQIPNPDLSSEVSRDVQHQTVNLDFPREIGGKRTRRVNLAQEELTLAELDLQAELRSVRRQVREGFYSLVAADERVRLAELELDIARRLLDAAQARFDTGAAPRLEVLQAELGVTRAETDLDLARSLRLSAQATLNGIVNLPPAQALATAGNMSEHTAAPTYEQALSLAFASNTDLKTFDRQIAIEQRRIDLLRAERVPTPVFSVGGVFNAPGEFDAGARAGVTIGLPLFSRNQGEIAGSIATTSHLRTLRDAQQRLVENAVYGVLAKVEAERRQADAYQQRLVPTALDLESLSEESYRAGRTSVLGVLEAQRSLRELRAEALQASLEMQMSLAELEELLGAPLP